MVTGRFGFATQVPAIGEVIVLSPPAAGEISEEPTRSPWEQRLARLMHKAREMQQLLAASPPDRRAELLARWEADLARTEAGLDAVLKEATKVVV